MRARTKKTWLVVVLLAAGGCSLLYAGYCYQYPYGASHCCDKNLWLSLLQYAELHDGHFPAGEATPEASLSLLYRAGLIDPNTLRGKTVSESVVREILERGDLLGPDTCGWHYVEGLTQDDDHRLALFWDKAGLDHNGGRMENGSRIVSLVAWPSEFIPGEKWPEFLQEQAKLMAARSKAANTATPVEEP